MTAPALALVSLLPTPSARLLLLLLSAMRILLLLLVLEPLRRPTLVALSTRRRTRASAERKKQIPSQLRPAGRPAVDGDPELAVVVGPRPGVARVHPLVLFPVVDHHDDLARDIAAEGCAPY